MGVPWLEVWDDDRVESQNVPSQVYRPSDVGRLKVEALKDYAEREELDTKIIPHAEAVTETTKLRGIVVSCVDSMASRKAIWGAVHFKSRIPIYFDGRVGEDQVNLYMVRPSDPVNFDEYVKCDLYDDNDVPDLPCGQESGVHTAFKLAAYVAHMLALHQQGKLPKSSIRDALREFQVRTSPVLTSER